MMKVDPNTLKIKNYTKEELAKMTYEERQKPYVCESMLCQMSLLCRVHRLLRQCLSSSM